MSAIIIHGADKKITRLIRELSRKLGAKVSDLTENQYEDLLLGQKMDAVKTGEEVSKSVIMDKLR